MIKVKLLNGKTLDLTFKGISSTFGLELDAAKDKLNMSSAEFEMARNYFNITEWPYQKLNKLIDIIETTSDMDELTRTQAKVKLLTDEGAYERRKLKWINRIGDASIMTFERLSEFFHMSLDKASEELNVTHKMMKKIRSYFNIVKWPYRDIKMYSKRMYELKEKKNMERVDVHEMVRVYSELQVFYDEKAYKEKSVHASLKKSLVFSLKVKDLYGRFSRAIENSPVRVRYECYEGFKTFVKNRDFDVEKDEIVVGSFSEKELTSMIDNIKLLGNEDDVSGLDEEALDFGGGEIDLDDGNIPKPSLICNSHINQGIRTNQKSNKKNLGECDPPDDEDLDNPGKYDLVERYDFDHDYNFDHEYDFDPDFDFF